MSAEHTPDAVQPLVLDEMDLAVMRLAASGLGDERNDAYEDKADLYGDAALYRVAESLRVRRMIEWGTAWTHCWLTDDGRMALDLYAKGGKKATA